jgi:hypothetical protein
MNPEFQRNLWLELTPQRLAIMAGGLALAFFAAALPGGLEYGPSLIARWLYLIIVVLYGSRAASLAVIGEIRDRTWDSQRLSSLGPAAMMWGKLLGATSYAWFGGVICLAVIVAGIAVHQGPAVAGIEAVYYVALGAIAQASAFLASLIAIRRRQSTARLGAFVCQLTGVVAAVAVSIVWSTADPASIVVMNRQIDSVVWWAHTFDALPFLLLSLAVFAAWILIACYREMRLELQLKNGPFVWLGFLVFIGVYVAGFDAWFPKASQMAGLDAVSVRLGLALSTYAIATYIMVLLEPKDPVHYRWMLAHLRGGRIGAALNASQAWMMSYWAAFAVAVALAVWFYRMDNGSLDKVAVLAAALGFLTRDVSIFVVVQALLGRRRSDLGAIVVLAALYLLLPSIAGGLKLHDAMVLFYPAPSSPLWLGPLVAWSEGLGTAALAMARISLVERPSHGSN